LLEGEILDVKREDAVLIAAHAVISEHLERHGLDAFFVVAKVRFVLGNKVCSDLAETGLTACVKQGADEQRLVDVAHSHLRVDELKQVVGFHVASVPHTCGTPYGQQQPIDGGTEADTWPTP
jgi:predicted GNAT family acetyltransferase